MHLLSQVADLLDVPQHTEESLLQSFPQDTMAPLQPHFSLL